jgi:hypothetical protein
MSTSCNENVQSFDPETLLADKHRALLADPEYTFRPLRRRDFFDEVERIRSVLNDAMAENYLFVPMTREEARFQLGPLKLVMDEDLLQIAEHRGQAVGVTMCVPDVVPLLQAMKSRFFPFGWWKFLSGKKHIRSATIIIILARAEYQAQGITRVLFYRLMHALKAGGYQRIGGTWIGDDNAKSLRSAEAIGMKAYHRLFMFEKKLP